MTRKTVFGILALAAALGAAPLLSAAPPGSSPAGPPAGPIEIISDRMIVQNIEKWADFLGSVRLTRGDLVMTSDKLRVYYEGDLLNPAAGGSPMDSIRKLVATGRVRIVSGNYVAEAEEADYDPAADRLVLTGRPATVTTSGNTIAGSRIVLNRTEGRAEAEGGPSGKVRARFHAEAGEEKKKTEAGVKPPAN